MSLPQSVYMPNLPTSYPQAAIAQAFSPGREVKRDSALVAMVEEFCKSHLAHHITVEDLARQSGLNRAYFSRMFKGVRGISPKQFLTVLRLEKALQLVSDDGIQVKEVAFLCGFKDPNYFCKVFRKNFGVSLGSYRIRGPTDAVPTVATPDLRNPPFPANAKPNLEIR